MGLVNINTNTLGAVVTAGVLRPPYYSDLDTWHKGIDGITFAESINNLPAKFLPKVADFNGTTNNCVFNDNGALNPIGDFTWVFDYIPKVSASNRRIFSNSIDSNGYELLANNLTLRLRVYTAVTNVNYTLSLALTLGARYNITITKESGTYTAYINLVAESPQSPAEPILATTGDLGISTVSANAMCMSNLKMYSRALSLAEIQDVENVTSGLLVFIPDLTTGYDVSTNAQHLATVNVTTDYDEIGTTYPNTNGYSLWQLAANPDIQVPFDINGQPLSLTAGVDIPAGYTHTRDLQAGNTNHNIYDSLVDMEYGSILQNDTAGVAYASQNEAYGCVFDGIINKGAGSTEISFISDVSDGIRGSNDDTYICGFFNNERLVLYRDNVALFYTVVSYISISTDYRILLWRNETVNQFITGGIGTFVMYIQGKSKPITTTVYLIPNLAEMELVDVSGGLGTNPITDNTYTTSNYIVNDLDAVAQVSKIKVNGKYISPYDFTVSTGAYSIIDGGNTSKSPELISSLVNSTTHPYETAIISGRNITSAINTVSNGSIYDNAMALDIAIGDRFRLTFDFVLNSGQSPSILLITNGDLISGSSSNIINPTTGSYDVILTATLAGAGKELIAWNSAAANWSMTNISLKKIVSANNIFDRSNTTRQTATSRASLFYDANHPFIYHINEIADPRIYETFFEAAYEYRIFSRIVLADNNDLIRYDEELNYGTQKTPSEILVINSYLKNYLMTIPEEIPLQL